MLFWHVYYICVHSPYMLILMEIRLYSTVHVTIKHVYIISPISALCTNVANLKSSQASLRHFIEQCG